MWWLDLILLISMRGFDQHTWATCRSTAADFKWFPSVWTTLTQGQAPKRCSWRLITGWWFQTFFFLIVHNIWDNPAHWRTHIFQRGWNHQPLGFHPLGLCGKISSSVFLHPMTWPVASKIIVSSWLEHMFLLMLELSWIHVLVNVQIHIFGLFFGIDSNMFCWFFRTHNECEPDLPGIDSPAGRVAPSAVVVLLVSGTACVSPTKIPSGKLT